MSFLNVTVDTTELRRRATLTVQTLIQDTRRAVHEATIEGANYAREHHTYKRRTGRLEGPELYGRIVRATSRGAVGEIRNDVPYARYVEEGTKPHVIRPKTGYGFIGPLPPGQSRRAKTDIGTHRVALRWYVGGRAVLAAFVNHPGSRPMPFMEPAAQHAAVVLVFEIENWAVIRAAALWSS